MALDQEAKFKVDIEASTVMHLPDTYVSGEMNAKANSLRMKAFENGSA